MTHPRPTATRPIPVAIAVIATVVTAVFGVAEGVLILLARYDDEVVADGMVLAVSLAGVAGILASLLLGSIAAAVWRGSNGARIAVTTLAALSLLLDAVTVTGAPGDLWWTMLDVAGYLLVILALWVGRGTWAFFRRRPGDGDAAPTAA